MSLRRFIRDSAFQIARHDVAQFLQDHEEELVASFREELARLDDEIPEENVFIDIKIVPLGETILRAALRAITRFLTVEELTPPVKKTRIPVQERDETEAPQLIDTPR